MSKRLKTNSELIKYIYTLKGKNSQIKKLLLTLSNDEIKALGEISANLLYGAISMTDDYKKILKPYKSVLALISSPKTSSKKRRALFLSKPKLVSTILEASKGFLKSII